MLKGQLSRVPCPGNSWTLCNFQAGLQALQQPHNTPTPASYSHSTSTSLHSICFMNSSVSSKRIFSKYQVAKWLHQSTELTLEMVASRIK